MGTRSAPRRQGLLAESRYELLVKIATGGQATVYVGRVSGSEGFSRLVAIKRAHPHLQDDPKARAMLIREARLASRIHHANVVPIVDVEESDQELLLVMDYIEGGALSELLEREVSAGSALPQPVALRILLDACAGLGAVHALASEDGRPLGLVHRDVSPQNILVGVDGTARLTDFGLAQLTDVSVSASTTVRGKLPYLAPEYVEGARFDQRCDVFSMGVVVWETLAGRRLFLGSNDANTLQRVVTEPAPPLSEVNAELGSRFDEVVGRALHKEPDRRHSSIQELARAMAAAAEDSSGRASRDEVGRYVRNRLATDLAHRRNVIAATTDPEQAVTASIRLDSLPIELPPLPTAGSGPNRDGDSTRNDLPRSSRPDAAELDPPIADLQEAPTTRMRARHLPHGSAPDAVSAAEDEDLEGPTHRRLPPVGSPPPPPMPELADAPLARRSWLLVAALSIVGLSTVLVVATIGNDTGEGSRPTASSVASTDGTATNALPAPATVATDSPSVQPAASAAEHPAPWATSTPPTSAEPSAQPPPPRPLHRPRPTSTEPALPDNPYKSRQGGP